MTKNQIQSEDNGAAIKKRIYIAAISPFLISILIIIFSVTRFFSIKSAADNKNGAGNNLNELYNQEMTQINLRLDNHFPQRKSILRPAEKDYTALFPPVSAGAAILICANTGEVLYEKNADMEIPPASMTKLFLMYSVLNMINQGKISYSDIIPIDRRAWACNMMKESSLMFLGKDHIVTLEELLLGLSISSGNDAAYAIAYALFGSMENFILSINQDIKNLGLTHTRIVESSGYSELNITTPREMAAFSKIYIETFPEALEKFHSVRENTYPQEHNLPSYQKGRSPQSFDKGIPSEIWTPITQGNTNKLLGILPGCDGLKTGHIYESGYNISLTSKRNGVRYISVTMLGPGNSMKEGDFYRKQDGMNLHSTAFNKFHFVPSIPMNECTYTIPLYGAKTKTVRITAMCDTSFVTPIENGSSNDFVSAKAEIPPYAFGKINFGDSIGTLILFMNEKPCRRIPLVAAEDTQEECALIQSIDSLMLRLFWKNVQ